MRNLSTGRVNKKQSVCSSFIQKEQPRPSYFDDG
jgi:hypothetical protein